MIARALLVLAACAGDPHGEIAIPLSSTGAGGATYSLPAGTSLHMTAPSFADSVFVDGPETTLTIDLPVNTYELSLEHPAYPSADWMLVRTNPDASTEQVPARLITTMPMTVTVLEDQTHDVVFVFEVANSGTITFANGRIVVSTQVDEVEASGARAVLDGAGSLTGTIAPTAPSQLAWLPTSALGTRLIVQMLVSTAWMKVSATEACIDAGASSMGVQGLLEDAMPIIEEANAGVRLLCITGSPNGGSYLTFRATRRGAPVTGFFAGTGTDIAFSYSARVELAEKILVGDSLFLGLLDGAHQNLAHEVKLDVIDHGSGVHWYTATVSGIGGVTYKPQL